jgi:electron transport complex protein RnfC
MKDITKKKKIVSLEDPDLLMIPLFERFGSKPMPVVKAGDAIKKYQLIGKSLTGFSAPVHSPVSGTIKKVESDLQIDGSETMTIFIRNDKKETEIENPLNIADTNSPEELLRIIEEAGVVGMGGAQFPAAMKYNRKGKKVKTFIINGAECEPYLTGDYALMQEHTREILEGILLADKILESEEIVIAFEESNKELNIVFDQFLGKEPYQKIRTHILSNEYPQGGELQLIKSVTGITVKKGSLPLEQGIIVSNVGTVYTVYNAVINKKPIIERVITISGENVENPGNYKIKIGTSVSHIIKQFKINPDSSFIISGGPMMSPQVRNPDAPMTKGSLGIVALPKTEVNRTHCIWCGYCVDVCPMKLMPMKFDEFYRKERYQKLDDYNINDCIECAACEYICPSKVPLVRSIKEGKIKLKTIKDATDRKTI